MRLASFQEIIFYLTIIFFKSILDIQIILFIFTSN